MSDIISRGRTLTRNAFGSMRRLQNKSSSPSGKSPSKGGGNVTTWTGGPTFTVKYNPAGKALDFEAKVQKNTYLGIAFGGGMTNLDAIHVSNGGTVPTLKVTDIFANGYKTPVKDTKQDLKNIKTSALDKDGWSTFNFSRALDTLDAKQDFKIECGKDYKFSWVGHTSSSKMSSKHNKSGDWNISFNADCSVKSGASTFGVAAAVAATASVVTFLY